MSVYGFQASEEALAITQIWNDKHQVNNIDGAHREEWLHLRVKINEKIKENKWDMITDKIFRKAKC